MSEPTTVKTRSPLLDVPSELQQARNRMAVAIKHTAANPTPENLAELKAAQDEVHRIEDEDRQAHWLLLEHACSKQRRTR